MSFHDLEDDWSDAPVTDSDVADVIDLLVSFEDRDRGSITFLVLDENERLLQPVAINDVPADADEPPWVLMDFLRDFLDEIGGCLLFARGRLGSPHLGPADLRWQQWIAQTFGDRLIGCYLATDDEVTRYDECVFEDELVS
ncbi:hypothetical protein [Yimella sp. NH-Cas1]|uniref:hypothetical protein n=1 Tax=Yimella sp. NH-Cas1 TaxID=2917726 RepID=UPI001EFC1A35|nr:hypothetical protein [Yimella sp. NH-Cas1]MCG8655109.1 hypothetical protein [Yimella sp. NH-Cas1]